MHKGYKNIVFLATSHHLDERCNSDNRFWIQYHESPSTTLEYHPRSRMCNLSRCACPIIIMQWVAFQRRQEKGTKRTDEKQYFIILLSGNLLESLHVLCTILLREQQRSAHLAGHHESLVFLYRKKSIRRCIKSHVNDTFLVLHLFRFHVARTD